MNFKRNGFISIGFIVGLFTFTTPSIADTVKNCFTAKDKICLEEIYSDIVTNPAPEKTEAIYLHGLLELEDENYKQAKKQFEMGVMFGEDERSVKALADLINSGKVDVAPSDCELTKNPEACLLSVTERQPDKSGVAYYFLAGFLAKTEPERAAQYTIKAAEHGHATSECLLAAGYAQEKASGPSVIAGFVPKLPIDYEKARHWGKKCGFGPFRGYKENYFKRYLASDNHKAFATFENKSGMFDTGSATPEIAASIAGKLCNIYYKRKPTDVPCRIVSVDGEWVDYFDAPPLPVRNGTVNDILKASARKSFLEEYSKASEPKVFVQGPLGNWYWAARTSLDEAKHDAIETCQNGWQFKDYGSACEIINVNGEWVK